MRDGIFLMTQRDTNVIEFVLNMTLPKHVITHLLLNHIHQWARYISMNQSIFVQLIYLRYINIESDIVTLPTALFKRLATVALEAMQQL